MGVNEIDSGAIASTEETFVACLIGLFRKPGTGCVLVSLDDRSELAVQCSWEPATTGLDIALEIAGLSHRAPTLDDSHRIKLQELVCGILNSSAESKSALRQGGAVNLRVMAPASDGVSTGSRILDSGNIRDFYAARLSTSEQLAALAFESCALERLRKYQREGVEWLLSNEIAILADDMGLGKTAQALSAVGQLLAKSEVRKVLIVVPKSLLGNWLFEMHEWLPHVPVCALAPPGRVRKDAWRLMWPNYPCILTTYEQLRDMPSEVRDSPPDLLICDEAHRLRNPESKTASGIQQVSASRTWALTGTPIERDASDLSGLLSVLAPSRFQRGPISASTAAALARAHLMRRTKESVLGELPPVTDILERLTLSPDQRASYRAAIRRSRSGSGQGDELALLSELRSIVDLDPATGQSAKLDRAEEIVLQSLSLGEKVVIFSYTLAPLGALEERLKKGLGRGVLLKIEGANSASERAEIVDEFQNNAERKCLLASMRAAGEGLTLTAASVVVFVNEWWNPSTNSQARDRVVRIGQVRPVRSYSFLTLGTIEERLHSILISKKQVYDQVLDQHELDRILIREGFD